MLDDITVEKMKNRDKKNLAIFLIVLVVILASMIYSMGGPGRYSGLFSPI